MMVVMQSPRRRAWLTCWFLALVLLATSSVSTVAVPPPASIPDVAVAAQGEPAARRSLPRDLVPSLRDADAKPRSYSDGCHARSGQTRARACVYGVRSSRRTVLLIGDSHAAQWLPTLEELAGAEGWKVYYLTKSACPLAKVEVVDGKRIRECAAWRRQALAVVADLHPDLVIASSRNRIDSMPRSSAAARREMWRAGWESSLRSLRARAGAVILLGDTPLWARDAVSCLTRYRNDIGRCDTPRRVAISASETATDRQAAADAHVPYVDTAGLVCRGDPCRAVWGRRLVLYDEQHMTVKWARYVDRDLYARLPASVLPEASPVTGAARPDAARRC
jgi:hypothetical protein